jgi:hypothetical protein
MDKHCKGCRWHHNAGWNRNEHPSRTRFNDWCSKIGQTASTSIGHCKLKNLKEQKEPADRG